MKDLLGISYFSSSGLIIRMTSSVTRGLLTVKIHSHELLFRCNQEVNTRLGHLGAAEKSGAHQNAYTTAIAPSTRCNNDTDAGACVSLYSHICMMFSTLILTYSTCLCMASISSCWLFMYSRSTEEKTNTDDTKAAGLLLSPAKHSMKTPSNKKCSDRQGFHPSFIFRNTMKL